MTDFLDTSCIVRYLIGEPPDMALQAAQIIDSEHILTLSELALIETAHVLESFYKVPRNLLVETLMDLVQRQNIQLLGLEKTLAIRALRKCHGSKRISFTDAFLWAQARQAGAQRIYSFDRKFPNEDLELVAPS